MQIDHSVAGSSRSAQKSSQSCSGRTSDKLLAFDTFATTFQFKLPEGKETFASCKGCCFTFLLVLVSLFYGAMQSVKLLTFDETDVMVSSRDAYFDAEEVYSKNLMYAFGITAYDSNPDNIEDPSIGVIKAYYKSWGIKDGIGGVDFEPLPDRECTQAELHLNN